MAHEISLDCRRTLSALVASEPAAEGLEQGIVSVDRACSGLHMPRKVALLLWLGAALRREELMLGCDRMRLHHPVLRPPAEIGASSPEKCIVRQRQTT